MKFKEPGFVTIAGQGVKDWVNEIKKDVEKNGAPQIIVVLVSQYEEKYYGELKKFITN